jgi:hypothetical protein
MMDSSMFTALPAFATLVGGVYGGFKYGKSQSLTDAESSSNISINTVEMLQAQVDLLKRQSEEKEYNLSELMERVNVLEGLVTQRAEVGEVHTEVIAIRGTVDRIAGKVGA